MFNETEKPHGILVEIGTRSSPRFRAQQKGIEIMFVSKHAGSTYFQWEHFLIGTSQKVCEAGSVIIAWF